MSNTEKYWQNPEMVKSRMRAIEEEGYEEFEGCLACIKARCREEKRGFTMDWAIIPPRRCKIHLGFLVRKALLTPKDMYSKR